MSAKHHGGRKPVNRCITRVLTRFYRDEQGQSLIETALLSALVLLPLMGGIVYFGGVVLTQENLAVSARHVARRASLDSLDKAIGKAGGVSRPATASLREQALGETATGRQGLDLKGVNWAAVDSGRGQGRLRPIDTYTAELEITAPVTAATLDGSLSTSHQMGVGVLFHGATVNRSYSDFAPIGRLAKIEALVPSVSATAVMPTELPPVGDGAHSVKGLLNLNSWITDIVNEKAPPLSP